MKLGITHEVSSAALQLVDVYCQEGGVEESPACIGKIDKIFSTIIVHSNVVKNASQEISRADYQWHIRYW